MDSVRDLQEPWTILQPELRPLKLTTPSHGPSGISASSTPRNDTNPPQKHDDGLHNPNGVMQAVVTQTPDLSTASALSVGGFVPTTTP